jgi:hypothetical protein
VSDAPDAQPPDGDAPGVVYCGGCNPHIDRAAVAAELAGEETPAEGATVYLSGCPRACASGHRLVAAGDGGDRDPGAKAAGGGAVVVVAGELVDGVPTPAADIGAAVKRTLKE